MTCLATLRYYNVFDVARQCLGIQPKQRDHTHFDHDPVAEAEAIVACYATKPEVRFASGRAAYFPFRDFICVPPREYFPLVTEYYATLFHELAHSTGHPSRLNRPALRSRNFHRSGLNPTAKRN